MKRRGHRRRTSNKGFALIGSYLALAAVLVYSNILTMRTMTERQAEQVLEEQLQARNLTQAVMEQLRESVYDFLKNQPQFALPGDAVGALQWIDQLGQALQGGAQENPIFDPDGDGQRNGVSEQLPLILALDSLSQVNSQNPPKAWLVSIQNPGGLATSPRRITIEAVAQAGNITKRLRAEYDIDLGASDVFRYGYFVNNRGWFNTSNNAHVEIQGDVRSNGNLDFTGVGNQVGWFFGDLYASKNPQLGATGQITGASQNIVDSDLLDYWNNRTSASPPPKHFVFPGEDANGNGVLDPGEQDWNHDGFLSPPQPHIHGVDKTFNNGWDEQGDIWANGHPDYVAHPGQDMQPMPYLGDLQYYKNLATKQNATLQYYDAGPDDVPGNADDGGWKTVTGVYNGPDGVAGTADDNQPLVVVGYGSAFPIRLNGPVVIPGDVIIAGMVEGRGSIYAGRNAHIIGAVSYRNPNQWFSLRRDTCPNRSTSGRVGLATCGSSYVNPLSSSCNFGTVCADGQYYPEGVAPPAGCVP